MNWKGQDGKQTAWLESYWSNKDEILKEGSGTLEGEEDFRDFPEI